MFSDLEKRYKKWLERHGIQPSAIPPPIRVVNPIFGTSLAQDKLRSGKISLTDLIVKPKSEKQKGEPLNGTFRNQSIDAGKTMIISAISAIISYLTTIEKIITIEKGRKNRTNYTNWGRRKRMKNHCNNSALLSSQCNRQLCRERDT